MRFALGRTQILKRCRLIQRFVTEGAAKESGSTIVAAVIGIAVVSALAIAYLNIYSSIRKVQAKVDFLNAISQIQLTISNTVNDANSWKSTIDDSIHNGAMSCLAAQTCTSVVPPTNFVLWPAGESAYTYLSHSVYDGSSPSAGFNLTGQPCTTFSLSGNSQCPIHVEMKWSTPGCSPAPCQPPVTVTANILYRPGLSSAFGEIDETHYTLSFQRKSNTANDPCAGAVLPSEQSLCLSPPYPNDTLVCTGSG